MKTKVLLCVLSAATLLATALGANPDKSMEQLLGTWSGGWTPEGGIRDAMTIELKREDDGKLAGRFVTPVSMNFSKAAFNSKTRMLELESTDLKSGKQYKLTARLDGTEIKGTVAVDNQGGQVHLIKWTYVPPIK